MTAPTVGPNIAAESLSGLTLPDGWTVGALVPRAVGSTGGTFSVSYRVTDPGGNPGFLKALDFSRALQSADIVTALQDLTNAYAYERDLVMRCAAASMSRVVKGLAYGQVTVPGFEPLGQVSYIIFEHGDGDVRHHLDLVQTFDLAWRLRALHHIALGLQQLHGEGIVHRDLKPSNVVVIDGTTSKVTDLGRAAQEDVYDPYNALACAGDPAHAPIETLYGAALTNDRLRGRSCDLYHLGAMTLFLFADASMTPAILSALDPIYYPNSWGGSYPDVLPYIRSAFAQVCDELRTAVPATITDEIVRVIRELCDPSPAFRGNPKQAEGTVTRLGVQRYVSIFDRLATRAEIDMR